MNRPALRVALVLVVVLVLVLVPGCVTLGRASYASYDWAGSALLDGPRANKFAPTGAPLDHSFFAHASTPSSMSFTACVHTSRERL